ncbi:MAG: hypothetical protein ABI759_01595 [Candidatus Solibacter sp.]
MSKDLETLIAELEDVTARMLSTVSWEQIGEFCGLLASRQALTVLLAARQDLDASVAERIGAVIQSGDGLVVRIMSLRESTLTARDLIEKQRRFTFELGGTVPAQAQPHHLDLKV